VNIDQARLMPHLRIRAHRAKADDAANRQHVANLEEVVDGAVQDHALASAGAKSWYQRPVDPRGLRGVPVVGVLPGAIAGTQPEAALLAKESVRRLR
jgi:hypothetical protein